MGGEEAVRAAEQELAGVLSPARAARSVAELRYAVSNDHAGTLYRAAVPAVELFLQVVAERPGRAREEALGAILDWWGCFRAEPGHEAYEDGQGGEVPLVDAIVRRVRNAEPLLRAVAEDPSGEGGHRSMAGELLRLLDAGWTLRAGIRAVPGGR
ncbi:hypothetical protein [Spirillospora sp. NPDC029432]|uniref:hypothetical protein n=1 Tax=Spirillospora sp. NPDC029432 TaxID=3154599 RepID=UPI0034553A9A